MLRLRLRLLKRLWTQALRHCCFFIVHIVHSPSSVALVVLICCMCNALQNGKMLSQSCSINNETRSCQNCLAPSQTCLFAQILTGNMVNQWWLMHAWDFEAPNSPRGKADFVVEKINDSLSERWWTINEVICTMSPNCNNVHVGNIVNKSQFDLTFMTCSFFLVDPIVFLRLNEWPLGAGVVYEESNMEICVQIDGLPANCSSAGCTRHLLERRFMKS